MDYIFYYHGDIPKYFFHSIDSIKKVDGDSKIYLCTNTNTKINNVETINKHSAKSTLIKEIETKFKKEDDSLWMSSMLRIFYNLNVAKQLSINKFVHFDSDVITYKSYKQLKGLLDESLFNITPLNNQLLVFGYSYVGDIEIYQKICESVFEIILHQEKYEKEFLKGQKMNEMAALYIASCLNPEYFNLLPILPEEGTNLIFDPASYGQYLGGVKGKLFSKKYATDNHIVGKEIINKNIFPKHDKSGSYVIKNEKRTDLANLHVHKKNLKKFMI